MRIKHTWQTDYITMPLWQTTVQQNENRYIDNKLILWTSEAKIHGKAYKHLKVNLDFFNSGEKREKGGDVGMP